MMKKGYWLILVFVIWCFLSALWYMFWVKGLSNDISVFTPQPTLQAIVEILLMITVAFLIGFGLAWWMREERIQRTSRALKVAEERIAIQQVELQEADSIAASWKKKWEDAEERILDTVADHQQQLKRLDEAMNQMESLQKLKSEMDKKLQQLDGEVTSGRFRIRLLENELADQQVAVSKLSDQPAKSPEPIIEHRDWSDHPFVRPGEADEEKDDLTEIKGIGPAFQRKLNALDIYNYRQISELSGEAVERLAEVIEVFPARIHRDNWIGQATRLYNKKLEG